MTFKKVCERGEKDHGSFASAGGKCAPLGFATPSWWTIEDGREKLRGPAAWRAWVGWVGIWGTVNGLKKMGTWILKSKKDERLLPSGCAGGIIGSLEELLAQKPYLYRHESGVRCAGRDAPENGASLVPSASGCLAFEWLDRIFWSHWCSKWSTPKNWSVWFQPDCERCPKEDTLCSELPALVKAWNLERLQMECETEAQQIVNTWNKSELKRGLFTATKTLEASGADGTWYHLGLWIPFWFEFSMALEVFSCYWNARQVCNVSHDLPTECGSVWTPSLAAGHAIYGVLRLWIPPIVLEFFK